MTEERIDIELVDKVSPAVATKLSFIAKAARDADSAINKLQKDISALNVNAVTALANASARVTSAAAKQEQATAKLVTANSRLAESNAKVALSEQRVATETARTDAARAKANIQVINEEKSTVALAAAKNRLATTEAKQAVASSAANAAQTLNNRVRQQGTRLTAQSLHQNQNLIYQLNDIVVGLTSGQKPLTVLIQQGSQISTIYGPGNGVAGTFAKLGTSLRTVLAPLAPAVITLAGVAAGFGLLTLEIRKATGVHVSLANTIVGTWEVAKNGLKSYVAELGKSQVGTITSGIFDFIKDAAYNATNSIIGLFVYAVSVIKALFTDLPHTVESALVGLVNSVINAIEVMINTSIDGLNAVITAANKLPAININPVSQVTLTRWKDDYSSALENILTTLTGQSDVFIRDYVGKLTTVIGKEAVKDKNKDFDNSPSVKKLKEEAAALQLVGVEREKLQAIQAAESDFKRKLDAQEKARLSGYVELIHNLKIQDEILKSTRGSFIEYTETLRNANLMLQQGRISLEEYNTAMAKTQLRTDLNAVDKTLPGFSDQAALDELRNTQQAQLATVQQAIDARVITEEEGAKRILEINQKLARDQRDLEIAKNSLALNSAESTFGSLADIAGTFAGKQSSLYVGLFAASKAFAIADSIIKIQQGIANAIALPFPLNLAAVASTASAAAGIVSTIQSVQFAAQGKKDGGFITGPGGSRTDSIPTLLSNGEFVINANATSRNRPLLEAINDNRQITAGGSATSNSVGSSGRGVSVNIQNYGTSKDFSVDQISPDEIRIIARDEAKKIVKRDAPGTVAADLHNPNGSVSKALTRNTDASRRRA